jgi:poly-gamma-glutamate synthase PgsB/CapB
MFALEIIFFLLIVLFFLGAWESYVHKRNIAKIPVRIHVNGTRGKSSVVRLIAAGLREQGISTCAKTTGTLARFILPDASEFPVFRPAGSNVIEQIRMVGVAAANGAQALVMECMALQPLLQWLSEEKFIRATHGVITNAREDHLDIMGPGEKDVAQAMAATTPIGGKLFTADVRNITIFEQAAHDRGTSLITVSPQEVTAITDEEIARFSYVEHKENVALALKVCLDLGLSRETALMGMWQAAPDPGALTIFEVRFFGRKIYFVNAFAANDPESTRQLWDLSLQKYPEVEKRLAIFNCRLDRAVRSQQLGEACASWPPADHYLLTGSGTYFFIKAAISSGIHADKLVFAENKNDSDIFEILLEMAGSSALVVGMGNAKGHGLSLTRFFRNRSVLHNTANRNLHA